ncbi:MAG: hypothetical protein AB7K24_26770, partial [Gemmataceae bacterium]
ARVAVSPAGKHAAALSQGRLLAWELGKGNKVQEWKGVGASDIAFADENLIVALGQGGTKITYDLTTGKSAGGGGIGAGLRNLFGGDDGNGVLTSDGKRAACFELGNLPNNPEMSVVLKDLAAGKDLHTIKLGAGGLQIAGFSGAGEYFAWVANDSSIHVFDVATGKELEPWQNLRASATITGLRFSPDSKLVALSDDEGVIRLLEVATAKILRRIGALDRQPPFVGAMIVVRTSLGVGTQKSGLAFSPDGKKLAVSFGAAGVRYFDVDSGQEKSVSTSGHRSAVSRVAVHSSGKTLTSLDRSGNALVWNLGTQQQERNFRVGEMAQVSVGGRWVAGIHGTEVRVFDSHNGKQVQKIDIGKKMIRALAISPDGKRVAVRSNGIEIWDVAAGRMLQSFGAPANAGNGLQPVIVNLEGVLTPELRFSPDGRLLAGAGSTQQLSIWNVDSGEAVSTIRLPKDQRVQQFVFSPNGACLLLQGDDANVADLYEIATGTRRMRLGTPRERQQGGAETAIMINGMTLSFNGNDEDRPSAALSPDGRLLALGGADGSIHLWNLVTGTELKSLPGHEGAIASLAFAPDSRTLFSGSKDTTILLWDLKPNQPEVIGAPLEAPKLDKLWTALGNEESAPAWKAQVELSRHPVQSADLVKDRLRPVVAPDAKEMARLIVDLDAEEFDTREQARAKLAAHGELAVPALKKALAGDVTLEVKQQLERLINQAGRVAANSDSLRSQRAFEVLELAGTSECRAVLRTLARGAEGAGLTRAAQATLQRLEAR